MIDYKEEGVETIVVGRNNSVLQKYCGTVGQSLTLADVDTKIKVWYYYRYIIPKYRPRDDHFSDCEIEDVPLAPSDL